VPLLAAHAAEAARSSGFWNRLFDTSSFPARWNCGEWDALTGWLHIGSDVATWAAYAAIPILLLVVAHKRRQELPMRGVVILFASFILLCGTVHLLEAIIFWWPAYRLSAVLKVVTAAVSITTAVVTARLLPLALELKSPKQLMDEVEARTAELRAAEAARAEAQEAAEAANAAKSRFLASMSHELRTPMAAVLGSVELLLEERGGFDAEQEERLRTIRRGARHQLELINEVLDLSRIESGAIELRPEPVDLEVVCLEALALVERTAKDKGVDLRLDPPADAVLLEADPLRLRQVVINLLSNALKFTDEGGITVHVAAARDGDEVRAEIRVRDTGVGMDADQLARVFNPYEQADASIARTFGGTGLGLSISRTLARHMGGDLTVASSPGLGSIFTFTLVGEAADAPPPAPACEQGPVRLDGVRVLLAEDQADLALVARLQLERVGAEVVHARDGAAAVAVLDRDGAFDVVLLDIQMPELDGIAAAKAMRAAGWAGRIVALTANALESERDECFAAGFDDFATKPLGANALRALVAEHARVPRAA